MFLTIYTGLIGLIIGSAINAIVWRLYVGRSWARGRSMCPECKHELKARDLVPVFSWLALHGKCRYCRAPIHWQYPTVELVTAALFALSACMMAPLGAWAWAQFGLWLATLTLLVILVVYDARWMILPDKIMLPAIGLGLVQLVLRATEQHSLMPLQGPVVAALVGGGAFYALAVLSRGRAMGGGDIKLVFLMGLLVGLKGLALALLIAFNTAAILGVSLIMLRLKKRRDHIPFGPFLAGGIIVAYLYGQQIVEWYLNANGL